MKEYKEILQLIKASQFPESDLTIGPDWDWDAIYNEAVSQAVIGIVASVVPKAVVASDKRWKEAKLKQTANYVRYSRAEEELKRVLDEADIPFVILKGNAAAIYYKNPELRKMGDIDFLVPQSKFTQAQNVLEKNGYQRDNHGENPRHIGYKKEGISFELHHHFSHEEMDIEDYVIDGLSNRVVGKINKHEFPMLPNIANGLVLLDHMKSHLRYGMGLRQIIDWMMYVSLELSDEVWIGEFEQIVRNKKLRKFAITVTRMCQMYLGLPKTITWCKDADEELCKRLMANVVASGNFGRKKSSGNSIETVSSNIRRIGLFRYLQIAGEHNWKAYKKHHWLKPFAWLYQIFRYARLGFRTGRNGKQISGDVHRSKERVKLLEDLGIK